MRQVFPNAKDANANPMMLKQDVKMMGIKQV
jgi:hypothetical protein